MSVMRNSIAVAANSNMTRAARPAEGVQPLGSFGNGLVVDDLPRDGFIYRWPRSLGSRNIWKHPRDGNRRRMFGDFLDRVSPRRYIFPGRPLRHDDGARVAVFPRNLRQPFSRNAVFN